MNDLFKQLGMFIESKRKWIMVICLLLIVPAMIGLSQTERDSSIETMVSTDSQEYKDYARFKDKFSVTTMVVLIEGENIEDLLLPQNVFAMDYIEAKTSENPMVLSVVGPAFMAKQAMASAGYPPYLPNDISTLKSIFIDPETDDIRSYFSSVFPDSQHALIALSMNSHGKNEELHNSIDDIQTIVKSANLVDVNPVVTGELRLGKDMNIKMGESLETMLMIAIILMLIILALIFRVRNRFAWRWLPLGIVLIAITYTFGITGFLSIPITTVTMSAMPVLIGLGADYAIQFHNRYDEEARRGETFTEALIDSVTHIGPAIGMAIVVGCLGFAALFFSPVPMIKDFGLTLIIGVVICYILSICVLTPILYWNDQRKKANKDKNDSDTTSIQVSKDSFVEKTLAWFAPRVIRKWAIILPIAVLLCVVGIVLDEKIDTETDPIRFMSSDLEVVQSLEELQAITGGRSTTSIFVEANDITDPEVLTWIGDLEEVILKEQSGLVYATNSVVGLLKQNNGGEIPATADEAKSMLQAMPVEYKGNLITEDFTAANIIINLPGMTGDEIKKLKDDLDQNVAITPAGVDATVTSGVIMQDKVLGGLSDGRILMTIIGLVFVFVGLFFLFRFRVVRAFMATLPIALIIGWSAIVMYLFDIDYNPLTATLGALVIGIGVEFTILLMSRYYEERGKGEEPFEAMVTAMTKIGRAIIASGLTVVGGFAALVMARDFPIVVNFGLVTMTNMLFALISTLVVLPPLIVLFDSKIGNRLSIRL